MALHWPKEWRNLLVPSVGEPTLWRGVTIKNDCFLLRMTCHIHSSCSYDKRVTQLSGQYKILLTFWGHSVLGSLPTEMPFRTLNHSQQAMPT